MAQIEDRNELNNTSKANTPLGPAGNGGLFYTPLICLGGLAAVGYSGGTHLPPLHGVTRSSRSLHLPSLLSILIPPTPWPGRAHRIAQKPAPLQAVFGGTAMKHELNIWVVGGDMRQAKLAQLLPWTATLSILTLWSKTALPARSLRRICLRPRRRTVSFCRCWCPQRAACSTPLYPKQIIPCPTY